MPLSARSEYILAIKDDVKLGSLQALKDLTKSLEKTEVLTKKKVTSLRKLVDTAVTLSKTPFLTQSQLNEASRIIDLLSSKIAKLRRDISEREIPLPKEELKRKLGTLKELEGELNRFTSGYESSVKRLNQLEAQRQTLLTRTLGLQKQYIRDVDIQEKFGALATQLRAVNVRTKDGQAQFARLRSQLNATTQAAIQQQVALGPLGRSWEKFRLIFARVFHALTSFLLLDIMRRITFGFIRSLFKFNAELEVMEARIGRLVASAEEMKKLRDFAEEFTIRTPYVVKETLEAIVTLKAYRLEVESNMKAIADWASVVGRDLSDTAIAFAKIVSYSPRTALLLTTRGLSLAAFENYIGRFGDRAIALRKLIEHHYGAAAERILTTFQGLATNISDLWQFIARTLGKPLFEAIKNDVRVIFNLLVDLNKHGKTTLTVFGEILKMLIYTGGLSAISLGITILISRLRILIRELKATQAAFVGFMKKAWPLLLTMGIVALIAKHLEYRDAINQTREAQEKLSKLSREDHNERIFQIELQIESLKRLDTWYNKLIAFFKHGLMYVLVYSDAIKASVKALEEQLKAERELAAEQRRAITLMNARRDAIRDFDVARQAAELGLTDFIVKLSRQAQAQLKEMRMLIAGAELLTTFPRRAKPPILWRGKEWDLEKLKDAATEMEAISIWLAAISKQITPEEAIKKLMEMLEKMVLEGGSGLDMLREGITDLIADVARMIKETTKVAKEIEPVILNWDRVTKKVVNLNAAIENLRGRISEAKELIIEGFVGPAGVAERLARVRKEFEEVGEVVSSKWENILITQELFEQRLARWEKMRKEASTENLLLNKELVDEQKELERAGKLITKEWETITDLQRSQVKNLETQVKLIEKLNRYSKDFATAFAKEWAKINEETARWREQVAAGIFDLIKGVTGGVMSELLFGRERAAIDEQIAERRRELEKVRWEKQGIIVEEDRELQLLAEINRLERERGSILQNIILSNVEKLYEKLQDMAMNELLTKIFEPSEKTLKELVAQYEQTEQLLEQLQQRRLDLERLINLQKQEGGKILIDSSTEDLSIGYQRLLIERQIAALKVTPFGRTNLPPGYTPSPSESLTSRYSLPPIHDLGKPAMAININGPIYGFDDFRKKVDQAIRKSKENVS